MGIADWMGRLFGGGKEAGRDRAMLERIWRLQQALGNRTKLHARDALLKAKQPLPFAEMPAFWGPTAPQIDEALSDEGFDTYVERLDPFARPEPRVLVGGVEALVPCGDGELLRLRFPAWHPAPEPGPDPGDANIVDTIVLDGSLDAPRTVGSLTVAPLEGAKGVLEITDDDEELHVVIGVGIPLLTLADEPTHLIGGFAGPISTEMVEALDEAGYTPQDGCFVEALSVPVAAAGVDPAVTSMIAPGLNIPCWLVGRGAPVGPDAQPLVGALLASDRQAAEAAAADADLTALADAVRHLIIEDQLDDAVWILEQADDEHAALANLTAVIADLRGAAIEVVEEGEADFVAAANHAMAAWADGDPDGALEIVQESALVTRSWLGNLVDAVIHEEEVEVTFRLAPLRYHLSPITPALDYARGGALDESERLLRRCLEMEPHHPSAAGTLALLLIGTGRHEENVAHCQSFIARVGAFPYLSALSAESLFALDRVEDAALALRRALESTPDHDAWWANLTVAMVLLGRKDAALATIEELDDAGCDMQLLQVLRKLV